MKPAEKIKKFFKDAEICINPDTDEQVFKDVLQAQQKIVEGLPAVPERIWSLVMKSPITKIAAAAVIIIAVLAGLPFIDRKSSGIALAQVLEKVEQTRAYMYTMTMTITGKLMPRVYESTMLTTISDDYGMKWYEKETDPNTGKTVTRQVYILPEKKMAVVIMPETKQYTRMYFGDESLAKTKQQNNDPREMIMQIMKYKYTRLDKAVIDGVVVEGFRTTDPDFIGAIGGDATSIEFTLWVDVENWLPFRSEMDLKSGEQVQVTSTTYDYRWNVPVHASDFVEPVIPEDFKPLSNDGIKIPDISEAAAVEGLKLFAEITGQYPKKLNMLELTQEIALLKDSQYLKDLAEKLKEEMSQTTEMSKDEIRDAHKKKMMEIMRPLQSIGYFYTTLVKDKKEPVYYGESVGPDNADMVLLKWKVSDDHYRVIFGDLAAEDLTADQFNELEK